MARRAEYRNELKTRVDDELYDAIQLFKKLNFIDSDSAALARIARMLLFGIFPAQKQVVASAAEHLGTRENA
jgi:hypothetical protein